MQDIIYCPTRTFVWRHLFHDVFGKLNLPDWPQLRCACVIPFYLGRVALWFLCQHWQLKPGDEVLMPAYNCGSEVDPFHAYGAKVVFYRVDKKAQIDYEDIKKRCTPQTRIVYITHYFGWPQEVGPVYQWCKERNIYVVEDCALSLFSNSNEGYLGTLADASIFSFKKFLPVPDGAALVLKQPIDLKNISLRSPAAKQTLENLLPFAKSSVLGILEKSRLYKPLRKMKLKFFDFYKFSNDSNQEKKPDMPSNYYFDHKLVNHSMSIISCKILRRENPAFVIQRRRDNYQTLYDGLSGISDLIFIHDSLPEGICPLACVVKTDNRKRLTNGLNAYGIAAFSWWEGYHQKFCWDDFPEARHLKDNILYLPIRQSLNTKHMKYIISCVKRLL
jgi:dTDP-4-amino-4,6-dideoxygalactose transaminase